MASRAQGGKSSSTKLLTTKLLGDDEKLSSASLDHHRESEKDPRHDATACSSPERREEGDVSSLSGTEGSAEGLTALGGDTSVQSILRSISRGSTIASSTPWKLTRAVVHLEDACKGRFSPCPPLEKKEPATRALFKLRWKYRGLEFAVVHLLLCELALSAVGMI